MITGAHSIIYSRNPDADRALLRDVLGLPHVDVGGGWLIFGLPPAEIAVHPSDENDVHELYFICDDIKAFAAAMRKRNIECGPVLDRGWGLLAELGLPGGGKIGVYQPRHARPASVGAGTTARPIRKKRPPAKKARKTAKKAIGTRATKKSAKPRRR